MAAPVSIIANTPGQASGNPAAPNTATGAHSSLVALRQAAQRLASNPVPSEERLAALERLRAQAIELLPQQRSHYIGQPLPLAEDERLAWEEQVALWHAFYFGFALCADLAGTAQSTLVWSRALDSLGRAIREHARVYRAVPMILWKELNSCYRTAEACEVANEPVPNVDPADSTQTCKSVYLLTLLHDAANLGALSGMQMKVVERWLPRWVQHAELQSQPPAQAARSPLAVHLDGDSGARLGRELPQDEHLRFVDTSELGARLRALSVALREQRSDPDLAVALRDLPRPDLERLLTHLYVQWCSVGTGRHEERQDSTTRAQVAVTIHAIHFQISGRAFRQPGTRYTREEEHDLATFGHITERTEHRLLTGRSSALEPWEIINQSSAGSIGMRRKPDLQSRIGHGQLVAVRTSSATPPMLGTVQRLRSESDGTLWAGIRLLASDVQGVAVRIPNEPNQRFERALLLAADESRKLPTSLIVPCGQYRPGMIVEMHDKRTEKVQLGEVLERGFEYERLACERS